jgi:GNAT superfamily N-acetyltransferase
MTTSEGISLADIRPLAERDLAEAQRIIRLAFGTFLSAPEPETFWADRDYAYGRFGAEHIAGFAAEEAGALVGSNFATQWGSIGFFGPLTIRPDLWNRSIGQRLVGAACDAFEAWGVRHAGLFTFAESAKHVWTYGKFGFHPRYLTAIMAAPAQANPGQRWSRFATLPEAQRQQAESAIRELTEQLYAGLDLGGEIRTVLARNLGDTVLLWDGDSRLAGVAICHWGAASEAGEGCCYVKFGAVRPGSGGEQRFAALLDACGDLAVAAGMPNVLAGVNLAREEAYRHMLRRGFRTQIQGVTMHRPNEPGYSRPELFILDDWR